MLHWTRRIIRKHPFQRQRWKTITLGNFTTISHHHSGNYKIPFRALPPSTGNYPVTPQPPLQIRELFEYRILLLYNTQLAKFGSIRVKRSTSINANRNARLRIDTFVQRCRFSATFVLTHSYHSLNSISRHK
jgi:hypothetical protein